MPLEPRPSDVLTKDNLLLGFSYLEWEPLDAATGLYGAAVPLGILSGQELQKEVSILELRDGTSGQLTVVREVLSSFKPSFQINTYSLEAAVAQYIFGASALTAVVADAAAVITNEPINVPTGANAERTFKNLAHSDVAEASFTGTSVTCAPITAEAVGTGDGTLGDASGDYALDYKPLLVADVTSVTVAGVAYTPIAVAAAASGNEVEVVVGTGATSGNLQFFQGGVAVNVTGAIVATYTPSHAFANLTDYVVDPLLGRIRFLNVDGATDALKGGQPMLVDYTYNKKSGYTFQPFTQGGGAFNGRVTIKHLPDVGINFVWVVPSATIRLDDNALVFGADDLATGTLVLTLNDAGGTDRYGTITWASEPEAAA